MIKELDKKSAKRWRRDAGVGTVRWGDVGIKRNKERFVRSSSAFCNGGRDGKGERGTGLENP